MNGGSGVNWGARRAEPHLGNYTLTPVCDVHKMMYCCALCQCSIDAEPVVWQEYRRCLINEHLIFDIAVMSYMLSVCIYLCTVEEIGENIDIIHKLQVCKYCLSPTHLYPVFLNRV